MASLNEVADERKRRNQNTFRAANERIAEHRAELNIPDATPYVCECWDLACRELVSISPSEYALVRGKDNRYIVTRGHEHGEALITGTDEWSIVEKGRSA